MSAHVLFVDDEPELCEWAAAGLRRRGCEVEWRTSAADALVLLESSDVDVVVADLAMSVMSGLELCQRIAANRPDVPVLVVTAFGSLDSAIGAIRAGAYDFLSKPFDIDVLAIAVERAAQRPAAARRGEASACRRRRGRREPARRRVDGHARAARAARPGGADDEHRPSDR